MLKKTAKRVAVTPESVGIPSGAIAQLIENLDVYRLHTHSLLISRGDTVVAEAYYAPLKKDFLHRMYSVSKSFVAAAVGLAVTEGLFSLEDRVASFFPEFRSEVNDSYTDRCTVRDMLMMRSNVDGNVYWWGRFESRVRAYYTQPSNKLPGGHFKYDSIGSFLLGCIIEKVTGKDFLTYMKDRALRAIGFSEDSYVLREPGGFAVGDSGVVCTARDLWLFARFLMKGGTWDGVRYIDAAFMQAATARLAPNAFSGDYALMNTSGYGYLIWKSYDGGFSLIGLGDQLAFCDTVRDVCLVMTADNQAERPMRHVVFHEFYRHLLPHVSDAPLSENREANEHLQTVLASRKLTAVQGAAHAPIESRVFGRRYEKRQGGTDISSFVLTADALHLSCQGREAVLPYGLSQNRATSFSLGTRSRKGYMGFDVEGVYDGYISAAWTSENTFSLMAQVVDEYMGSLNVHIAFIGDEASVHVVGSGQYVFDKTQGSFIAKLS
ncbi:MAG: serine hydrolase [Clostridiales bacterium]|nr:serine hydrolase [Clostridiales bacterium]